MYFWYTLKGVYRVIQKYYKTSVAKVNIGSARWWKSTQHLMPKYGKKIEG
jgi:hypothetical protein